MQIISPNRIIGFTALIITVSIFPTQGICKDFGVHGTSFNIKEVDLLDQIYTKLRLLENEGKIQEHQEQIANKAKETIRRPPPVKDIINATKNRSFYFDPSISLDEDLRDDKGSMFYKAGTKINPLESVPLTKMLVFYNGESKEQEEWALGKYKSTMGRALLIMTSGAPLEKSEEIGFQIYFDQMGLITSKLGIKQVPAFVVQEGNRLKIEEVCLDD